MINVIQRWGMGPDKQWADIPYHFLIAPAVLFMKAAILIWLEKHQQNTTLRDTCLFDAWETGTQIQYLRVNCGHSAIDSLQLNEIQHIY